MTRILKPDPRFNPRLSAVKDRFRQYSQVHRDFGRWVFGGAWLIVRQ
jgi:hypothetical protein